MHTVGAIPTAIGKLISLTEIALSMNQLTGKRLISKKFAIGRPVYHMTFFDDIMHTQGSIPTEIGRLINLKKLRLFYNQLAGKRPISKKYANGRPVYQITF